MNIHLTDEYCLTVRRLIITHLIIFVIGMGLVKWIF